MTQRQAARAWRIAGWTTAAVAVAAYTVTAHRAASASDPGVFEVLVIVVPAMALILLLAWRSRRRTTWVSLWLVLAGGLFAAREDLAASTRWVLLMEHVGINLALGLGFGRTLVSGSKPLVSRLAEMVHGNLSPLQARYTRGATLAWTAFFGLLALASVLLFALAPVPVWSAFVNLLTLPLVIAMFAGEYLVRVVLLPRGERAGFFEAMGAYRRMVAGKPRPH